LNITQATNGSNRSGSPVVLICSSPQIRNTAGQTKVYDGAPIYSETNLEAICSQKKAGKDRAVLHREPQIAATFATKAMSYRNRRLRGGILSLTHNDRDDGSPRVVRRATFQYLHRINCIMLRTNVAREIPRGRCDRERSDCLPRQAERR
jgi:hypothetical protein